MENQSRKAFAATAVALSMLLSAPVFASGWNGWGTPCTRTAWSMLKACGFDVRDDRNETIANCRNISDADARDECFDEAADEAREEYQYCGDQYYARKDACSTLGEFRYDPDPLLDPANMFIDPDDIPDIYGVNPYVSLESGHTYLLRAGEDGEETVVVHVTDESREILGVLCRVVLDIVFETEEEEGEVEYETVEVTDDWFAQDTVGNVYYCGEVARNFEDGILRDLDGSFEAGIDFAKSGELIRAFPMAGDAHRQEFALGEAEDIVLYVDTAAVPSEEEGGDNEDFPCAPDLCLKSFEFAPLEPESSEFKYYLPGTGFVLAVSMEDGEFDGEREELVCIGDSVDILEDPACEIDDPEVLLEELCEVADAFCGEEE